MHHIVFLDRAILPIDLPRPSFPHTWSEYPVTGLAELDARLQGATIVISSKIPLRGETLAKFPGIRFIAVAGTGVDPFDLDYCRQHGVLVSHVRGYAEHTVPEHAFMLILALARNLPGYRRDVEAGLWERTEPFCLLTHPISDLHGKTLGIVGEGAIGQGAARIARGFGMRVLFADHPPPKEPGIEYSPLEEVLAESDVVTLHCPLTTATRGLIGEPQLQADEAQRAAHQHRARRAGGRACARARAASRAGSPAPGSTCSASSLRATAIRCCGCACPISSSRPTSPGRAARRCKPSPSSSSATSRRSSRDAPATWSLEVDERERQHPGQDPQRAGAQCASDRFPGRGHAREVARAPARPVALNGLGARRPVQGAVSGALQQRHGGA